MSENIVIQDIKNASFIEENLGRITKCYSFEKGISIHVIYETNTGIIRVITFNGKNMDVTKENIDKINRFFDSTFKNDEQFTIDEFSAINFIINPEINSTTCLSFDHGITLAIVYNNETRVIESIKINNIDIVVTRENISYIQSLFGIGYYDKNGNFKR